VAAFSGGIYGRLQRGIGKRHYDLSPSPAVSSKCVNGFREIALGDGEAEQSS
jgi:hypothetical protein